MMTDKISMKTLASNLPAQSDFETWRNQSKSKFDQISKRRILGSRDGLDLKDSLSFISRSNVVQSITEKVLAQRAVLIRAPPASGKTSIAQLLYLYLFESDQNMLPILMNGLKLDKTRTFDDQFVSQSGLAASMLQVQDGSEGKQVIIIIDEAQLLYSTINRVFWDWLKSHLDDVGNLYFVFFAAYGENVRDSETSTPFEFPKTAMVGLECLLLVRSEFEQLVSMLCQELDGFETARDQIYQSCEGHVGLVTTVLNELIDYSKEVIQKDARCIVQLPEEKILEFLISPRLASAIRSSRSFALGKDVPLTTLSNIAMMFLGSHHTVAYEPVIHDKLVKSGIFVVKNNGLDTVVTFSAPVIRRAFILHALHHLSANDEVTSGETFTDVRTFVVACLRSLRRENLLKSNALLTHGNLNESKFKVEFFRIAHQLLCGRAGIDPEVGQVFKTADNASVDFYISGNFQWAIEFIIDSDRVRSHLERFADDGKYKPIPCKDYLVVDFVLRRSDSPGKLGKSRFSSNNGYVRVIYDENFSRLKVEHLNSTEDIDLH